MAWQMEYFLTTVDLSLSSGEELLESVCKREAKSGR